MKFILSVLFATAMLAHESVAAVSSPPQLSREDIVSPSPDNTCGNVGAGNNKGYRCGSINAGRCCSSWGECGADAAHCGTGCQVQFGRCDGTKTTTSGSKPVAKKNFSSSKCGAALGLSCSKGLCCSKTNQCGTSDQHCGIPYGCQSAYGTCDPNVCPVKPVQNSGFELGGKGWTVLHLTGQSVVDYADDEGGAHGEGTHYVDATVDPDSYITISTVPKLCIGATYSFSAYSNVIQGAPEFGISTTNQEDTAYNPIGYRGVDGKEGWQEITGSFVATEDATRLQASVYNKGDTEQASMVFDDIVLTLVS